MVSGGACSIYPLGCYLQYLHFFFFTELSSENPIVPNGAHSVFPILTYEKGFIIHL